MLSKSVLSYQGPLSFSTIDSLLSDFKLAAQDHEIPFKTYKKMIYIMIEALENITKYSDQLACDTDATSGFCPTCEISKNATSIELVTSNPVKNEDVDSLREKIDHVNSRSASELKELYLSIISNGKFSSSGGAGLGFIEMAKTAGNKLEYTFENLSEDYSLYTIRIIFSI